MPRLGVLKPALWSAVMGFAFDALVVAEEQAATAEKPDAERCIPMATCNAPGPGVLTRDALPPLPIFLGIHLERLREDADAGNLLTAWEQASATLVPLTDGERQRATQLHRAQHSGHELALMLEFRGPVDAGDLQKRYEWTRCEAANGQIVLTGVPREAEERLFFPSFQVTLDAETHLPVAMQFADRGAAEPTDEIRLVTYHQSNIRPRSAVENGTELQLVVAEAPAREEPDRTAKPRANATEASPELQAILHDWEWAASRIKRLEMSYRRFVYDNVFATEKRSQGRIVYEAPDRGRIDVVAPSIAGETSQRRDASGKAYQLVSDSPQSWIWSGDALTITNETEATYEEHRIPRRPAGGREGFFLPTTPQEALPFVFGPGPVDVRSRFTFRQLRKTDEEIWLQATPLQQPESGRFSRVTVILDAQTCLPRALQLLDPAGSRETVYTFSDLALNRPQTKDPLLFDASRYRERVKH